MDLSRLTQLREVIISGNCTLDAAWVFPPQVRRLQLGLIEQSAGVAALSGLPELQELPFVVGCYDDMEQQPLHGIAQLPSLHYLALMFEDVQEAFTAAHVLPQLPQLRALTVVFRWHNPSYQQWDTILAAVAACTGLTQLELDAGAVENPLPAPENDEYGDVCDEVAACAHLAGLTNLTALSLDCSDLAPGDVLALTALTGLTRLELACVRHGVGDLAACALASSMKQLPHLDLQDCDLGGAACLGAIAHLTQLTELRLAVNEGLTQQGLMLMTGLRQLQQLEVSVNDEVTEEVVERFWMAVRQQQQV
jgi:hypothetical protein